MAVLRDPEVVGIVEDKDATAQQRSINEINTGILAASTARLEDWLGRINNHNAQGEYYLTDTVALAVADGVDIGVAQPGGDWETQGVNSRVQQAALERAWQQEQARRLLEQGVLADPARFDLRGTLPADAMCLLTSGVCLVMSPWATAYVGRIVWWQLQLGPRRAY